MDDTGQEIFGDDILDSTGASEQLESRLEGAEQFGRGGVITARGTVDGVVVRLDGRVDRESLKSAVEDFLSVRRAFLGGNEVSLEWIGARPDESLLSELSTLLLDKFNITVKSSRLRDSVVLDTDGSRSSGSLSTPANIAQSKKHNLLGSHRQDRHEASRPKSLFDGMEAISDTRQSFSKQSPASKRVSVNQSNLSQVESFWDDADARVVYTTLRSGQKIETDHSLIVFGDVNSGAEIVAGGDIIVLGTLRGVAHAGAYDETGGGRVIFALNLQATQLRIGMVISRGSADSQKAPEIARVEGGLIIVEPYSVKNLGSVRNLGSKN